MTVTVKKQNKTANLDNLKYFSKRFTVHTATHNITESIHFAVVHSVTLQNRLSPVMQQQKQRRKQPPNFTIAQAIVMIFVLRTAVHKYLGYCSGRELHGSSPDQHRRCVISMHRRFGLRHLDNCLIVKVFF